MRQPEWAKRTAYLDSSYELAIWKNGMSEEKVELTREEYVELKRHLAEMRGIEVTDAIENE